MTQFGTAAHIFKQCEITGKTIRQLFEETGIFELSQEEIEKLAVVMTERDVQWCVDELMRSCESYDQQAREITDRTWRNAYFDSSREMAARAAMWAISKPLTDEER